MQLESISGSQVPNGLALLLTGLAVLMAFRQRAGSRWIFVFLWSALLLVVIAKNVAYGLIVADHAESSTAAHHDYAQALLGVTSAQLTVAVCLFLTGLVSKRFVITIAPALACVYAAICMNDWRQVYLTQDAAQPVHYEVGTVWLHWALLAGVALAIVAMIAAGARRRRPQQPVSHKR